MEVGESGVIGVSVLNLVDREARPELGPVITQLLQEEDRTV